MAADTDRVLAQIDATLAGDGGTVNDYSVSACAMRWAPEQPAPDDRPPGAWAEAILAQARHGFDATPPPLAVARPMTMAEIQAVVAELRPQPPTRLRCHPSVISALANFDIGRDWWGGVVPPELIQIEVIADTGMAAGAWELMRGDELVGEGVIA